MNRFRGSRGFTMVEVLVSLVIFTIGVLGLAGSTMWIVRQTTVSEASADRTAALQSAVERLRAVPYDSVKNGSLTSGAFSVAWTVTDASRSKLVTIVTTGHGLKSGSSGPPQLVNSVSDTIAYRVYNR